MRMYDLINKKKYGYELTGEEIQWMIENFVEEIIPDYQMSAMLMAIYFQSMSDKEVYELTMAMARSGDIVDLSSIRGIKVDKHSTGGVGDKTTLIVAPIVAACGVKVAKMSGKGLGHTGGTIDKLESIPGYRTSLSRDEFYEVVNSCGLSVIGQSGNITPADKKLYALRDVTTTVDSIPLIAASVMSKKIAAGSDCILLDVKTGNGAFMKTMEESEKLADIMIEIGERAGKKVAALITDMDNPLGNAIGNSLEVIESVETLLGEGPQDLMELSGELAVNMLLLAEKGTREECEAMVKYVIQNKVAYHKFLEMVRLQGGDTKVIENIKSFPRAKHEDLVRAPKAGFITHINTEQCGMASVVLEAGRENKDSMIDYTAGILLKKKVGDKVREGEILAVLYTNNQDKLENAVKLVEDAYIIDSIKIEKRPIILGKRNKFLKR